MQIGPRIRVGGTLGKIGQEAKIGAGKVLSNKYVDAGLALIPGVGPGISAAANAAGHVLDTSNGGIHTLGDVGHMALDAGEAYLGGKGANMIRDAVVKNGLRGAVSSGVSRLRSAPSAVLNTATGGGSASGGAGGGGLMDRFRSIGGLLNTGLNLANTAEGVYSGYQGSKLRGQMLDQANKEAAQNAALRASALDRLRAVDTAPRPDLSGMLPASASRFRRVSVGGAG